MKVLILSVTAGYGHHAAARAVSDQLLARGAEVKTIDVYQVLSPAVKQTIDKGYRLTARRCTARFMDWRNIRIPAGSTPPASI